MAWNSSNRPLTQTEMEANATMVRKFFVERLGWSVNAVAAMLANMQAESSINPGRWESGEVMGDGNGVGLVQWTPWTKLYEWVENTYGSGTSPLDGNVQCERIKWEFEHHQQWIYVDWGPIYDGEGNLIGYEIPGMEWADWIHSELDVYYLAQVFTTCYERPKEVWQPWRWEQAEKWLEYLGGENWKGKAYWLYLYVANRRLKGSDKTIWKI